MACQRPRFRDLHLLFDEQAAQILDTTDEIAERVRKIGGTTLRSIGHISKLQSIEDIDEGFVPAPEMLIELLNDNKATIATMRKAHKLCDKHEDVATASLLENYIDAGRKARLVPVRGEPDLRRQRQVSLAPSKSR